MEYSPLANALVIFSATYLIWIEAIAASISFFKSDKDTRLHITKALAFILPASYLIAFTASLIWNNPRPFIVEGFDPLASNRTDNGFPSDHTLFSAIIAGIFIANKKILGAVFFVIAVIIGIGRVYAGVHHSIDIIGSLVIVSIVTGLYWYTKASLSRRN